MDAYEVTLSPGWNCMADGAKLLCLYCGQHFKLFDEAHLNSACTTATQQAKQEIE